MTTLAKSETNGTRRINRVIDEAERRGRYVFMCDGPGSGTRIIKARTVNGLLQVKGMTRKWYTVYSWCAFEER